jgi:RNA polymerase primary sigma factor
MAKIDTPFDEMDVINALLAEGNEQGYLLYEQIVEAIPDLEENLPLLEVIMEETQAAGVPIYESEEDMETPLNVLSTANANGDGSAKKADPDEDEEQHAAPLFDLSNVPIDDSVGFYFREMGQQSLLSADEEVYLAKEIEAGRAAQRHWKPESRPG